MGRQQTIDRITERLPEFDEATLNMLRELVERLPVEDDAWDKQIRGDSEAGKLDHLIEQAIADHRAGRTREI